MEQRRSDDDPEFSWRDAAVGPIAHTQPGRSDAASPSSRPRTTPASDSESAAQMAISRTLMKRWHNVLRELAK